MQQTFTSSEVMALTGITARQLQWWDERRIATFVAVGSLCRGCAR
jgi:DNA-binding transcriptional MerR regulator